MVCILLVIRLIIPYLYPVQVAFVQGKVHSIHDGLCMEPCHFLKKFAHFKIIVYLCRRYSNKRIKMMQSACIYNNGVALQKDANFSANFIADYLVNPNNLLTHTHTHTHTFAPPVR